MSGQGSLRAARYQRPTGRLTVGRKTNSNSNSVKLVADPRWAPDTKTGRLTVGRNVTLTLTIQLLDRTPGEERLNYWLGLQIT
jgi:hypothetical protein